MSAGRGAGRGVASSHSCNPFPCLFQEVVGRAGKERKEVRKEITRPSCPLPLPRWHGRAGTRSDAPPAGGSTQASLHDEGRRSQCTEANQRRISGKQVTRTRMPEPSAWDASPGTRRARGFQADWRPPHQHPGYHHACLSLSLSPPPSPRASLALPPHLFLIPFFPPFFFLSLSPPRPLFLLS